MNTEGQALLWIIAFAIVLVCLAGLIEWIRERSRRRRGHDWGEP